MSHRPSFVSWDAATRRTASLRFPPIAEEYWRLVNEGDLRLDAARAAKLGMRAPEGKQSQPKKTDTSLKAPMLADPPSYKGRPKSQGSGSAVPDMKAGKQPAPQSETKRTANSDSKTGQQPPQITKTNTPAPKTNEQARAQEQTQDKKDIKSTATPEKAVPPTYSRIKAKKATNSGAETGEPARQQQDASKSAATEPTASQLMAIPPTYRPKTGQSRTESVQTNAPKASAANPKTSKPRQTNPGPAKKSGSVQEKTSGKSQASSESAPGVYTALRPPSTGDKHTLAVLAVEQWTRWMPHAGAAQTYGKSPDQGYIMKKVGTDKAVAHCLDPSTYGGNQEFNLGFCAHWVERGECDFDSWELCPLRHWKPDQMERRWMKESFLKSEKWMRWLNKQPLAPDVVSARYTGRPRQYWNSTWFTPKPFVDAPLGNKRWQDFAGGNKPASSTDE